MDFQTILSTRQCEKILENYTKTKDITLKSYSVNPLDQVNGYIAVHYKVSINYYINEEIKETNFFLKCLNESNPVIYDISKEMMAFEREKFFYDDLKPLVESSELSSTYAPMSYLCENGLIVLEDLSLQGYTGFLKNEPLDFPQCKKCLEVLARFHSAPIVYEHKRSKILGRKYHLNQEFGDVLKPLFTGGDTMLTKYLKCSMGGLCELIDTMTLDGINKQKFKARLLEAPQLLSSLESEPSRSTIVHGDLWCNNFMCTFTESGDVDNCKLIDFQTLSYGPPARDVVQFLFSNTSKKFRDNHMEELLEHYYSCFSTLLEDSGLNPADVLAQKDFRKTCDTFLLPMKIFCAIDRCTTAVSDEDYLLAAQSPESHYGFFFDNRGTFIMKAFKEDVTFRELITEDINELKEMLLDK